jgi:transketolase
MQLTNYLNQPTKNTTRDGFGQGLVETATQNQDIVGLCADLTESTRMNWFSETFPDRFFQMGVAEENMIGVAAGLALGGKISVAASYSVFSPGNSLGPIRSSVCYSDLPVIIVGGHAGLTTGPDGATHQALEDLAIMRALPNMTVVVPADMQEAKKAIKALIEQKKPGYIRTSRFPTLDITTEETPFEIGRAIQLTEGDQITLIATGTMVEQALLAANSIQEEGVSVRVVNMHTIKPIDQEIIIKAAQETKAIITVEEHQVAGGLGSAVAEVLATLGQGAPLKIMGMQDSFGESGDAEELLEKYGLSANHIRSTIKTVLADL